MELIDLLQLPKAEGIVEITDVLFEYDGPRLGRAEHNGQKYFFVFFHEDEDEGNSEIFSLHPDNGHVIDVNDPKFTFEALQAASPAVGFCYGTSLMERRVPEGTTLQ